MTSFHTNTEAVTKSADLMRGVEKRYQEINRAVADLIAMAKADGDPQFIDGHNQTATPFKKTTDDTAKLARSIKDGIGTMGKGFGDVESKNVDDVSALTRRNDTTGGSSPRPRKR